MSGKPIDGAVVSEYIAARDTYEAATRPPNSHAPARQLKPGDPLALRYRQARAALTAAQQGHAVAEPMTGELLPCPFCGKSNQDRWPCEWLDGTGANVIRCAWCHGAAPAKTWNRRTAPAPSVLEGWVLVPVRPARDMRDAYNAVCVSGRDDAKAWLVSDAYAAMLAAAPSAKGRE